MVSVKKEPENDSDFQSSLLPRPEVEIPVGFDPNEWEKLTEGFRNEEDEALHYIAQRGQVGSRKGRPTGLRVPFKGELSSNSRAVAQRDRAALRDQVQTALDAADAADRAAKSQLKKKIMKTEKYKSLSERDAKQYLEHQLESLAEKRQIEHKSREWLEMLLARVQRKWEQISIEVGKRRHQKTIEDISKSKKNSSTSFGSRAEERLYGSGGVVEKFLREIYQKGLTDLNNNTFENEEAKAEWQQFVAGLTPAELEICISDEWTFREPTPIEPLPDDEAEDVDVYEGYVRAGGDSECEEEVLEDSDIEDIAYSESYPVNSDDEFGDKTDFEGFSDDEQEDEQDDRAESEDSSDDDEA